MLVAPAGYGKTVLAHEWSSGAGRIAVWCSVRPQHVDVAALAVDVARRADTVAPGCGRRLRERLATAQEPAVDARVAAEMLAEDLHEWPDGAWLVLDDYHHIVGAEDAEVFVHDLVAGAPINLLVTTRERPTWVMTRDLIYGGVFELGQTELAMTRQEAGQILADRPPEERAGLIALADGWPAVLGLARRLPHPVDLSAGFPDEVYDFFAEEVYQSLAPDMRRALCLFSLAPMLDRDLAAVLAGPDAVEAVFREAESIGLMSQRDGQFGLHPLAATFLLQRATDLGTDRERGIRACLDHYRANRDWDTLFEVILREGLLDDLLRALMESLPELLNNGRLATIRGVIDAADNARSTHPVIDLARSEVLLRAGSTFAAGGHALNAFARLDKEDPLSFRAISIAARAAHIGNREDEAVELYRRAEAIAHSERERREAMWGLLSSLSQMESDEAFGVLAQLSSDDVAHVPEEIVREATRRLLIELRSGALRSLQFSRNAFEVIAQVEDPIARCSFRNVFSAALSVYGEYGLALAVASELRADAEDHRLDFVLPVASCTIAQALCGLRRFAEAEQLLVESLETGARAGDALLEPLAAAILVRLRAQDGRIDAALSVPCELSESVLSVRGEFLASRALALACTDRLDEAWKLASAAVQVTRAIEPRMLERAVSAIIGLRSNARDTSDRCLLLVQEVEDSLGYDLLVAAYRASPELLSFLLRSPNLRPRVMPIMRRVGDESLINAAGLGTQEGTPEALLSRRELEVYELLCSGLSNRQIAACLYIAETTVKVHVHHIFDKLGIRSRHALALGAARRRAGQATDAT
jgi:DNA-binding CsgD family transcriptional regulator